PAAQRGDREDRLLRVRAALRRADHLRLRRRGRLRALARGAQLRMLRSQPEVCFEVDRIDSLRDWQSVVAMGTFSELEAREAEVAMDLLKRRLAPLVASATGTPDGLHHSS